MSTTAQLSWRHNSGEPADPPSDAEEWAEVVESVGRGIRVVLVYDEQGNRWGVSLAVRIPVHLGEGPHSNAPEDVTHDVIDALRAAGKPVTN